MKEQLKSREAYKEFYEKQGECIGLGNESVTEGWERVEPLVPYFKGRVLELGCQTGGVTKIISKYADSVVAIDVSSTYIKRAIKNCSMRYNITWINMFAEDISYENEFDVVDMSEILEHVFDPKIVIEKSFKALKPGGWVLFSTPIEAMFPDPIGEHVRSMSVKYILELFKDKNLWIRIAPEHKPHWFVGGVQK